ncbi:MAG TPA: response regulator [Aggregatilinea sp.]|uniref:hybrid sensor histidine kinase/response regulator n=1 Tax=Aggregatilinea sp. TaxID=2806333 RepID=UPI002C16D1CA|nr:response regulator [Aggregatilinea sp.]HML22041.1 response regulator [Aggregatilinea sp.]
MGTGNTATILVVEDDMHLMEGIRDILELNGYRVFTATNGVAGLEVLNAQPKPPDLIVSDIMMPRMDGYDFFNAVRARQNWVTIPFIFLTAKGERDDIHRGKRMGAEDYVVKPFDADDLLVAVSAKLDRKKQLDNAWHGEVSDIKHNILTILNHELRTPLTYVVAYADMLHRDADDLSKDDMRAFLRGINAGAGRLRRLVENFILLVELETGEAENTYNWRKRLFSSYEALLYGIQSKYFDLAQEHGVEVEVAVEENLLPVVVDLDYFTAALECLVDNAVKFSDKPGYPVQIQAFQTGDAVAIAVRDQGRGIPPQELENIFDTFYQINREKYEDQGAGSGLAIVDGVVKLHGGSVDVESTFGEGSTFVVYLPVVNDGLESQA